MKLRHLIMPVIAACALSVLAAPPASAKDKWINLTTKNFNIVSNADEGDTRELGERLEQFRFVFSQLFNTRAADTVPVTVMVFKSDGAFTPFKPLYNGKPTKLAGYFQPGKDENLIALNIAAGSELRPMAVIFHEYTHLLTSFTVRQLPLWLKEGVAELYSTFDVKRNDVTLGVPVSSHVYLLRDNRLMPFAHLFEIAHGSPEYNEGSKRGIFYAESWALAHYLMFGEDGAHRPKLIKFVDMLMSGTSADRAFAEAFKTDYASMEKELRRYVGKDRYSGMIYSLKSTQVNVEMTVSPLAEAEVQFYLGNLLFRTRRPDEAETYFKKAEELDPKLARPHEGLGFLAMQRSKHAEAKEHFKQAIALGSKNHLAHYYYAEALQREALQSPLGGRGLNPELVKTIVDELKESIKLMPTFAYSHSLLGFIRLVTGENLEEGAQMAKRAMQLDPQNKRFILSLAQIQMRMKDYAAAKKTLEPLLAEDDDSSLKSSAISMMTAMESHSRPIDDSPGVPADSTPTEPNNAPRLIRRSEESQGETARAGDPDVADPNSRPTLRLEGVQTIGGMLAAIECDNGMVLAFRTRQRLLRYSVSDVANLQFVSQDPDFKGNIGCGPINLKGYVYFKPISGQTRFAGDAVAVEFTK